MSTWHLHITQQLESRNCCFLYSPKHRKCPTCSLYLWDDRHVSSKHSTWKAASPRSHGSVQSVCCKTHRWKLIISLSSTQMGGRLHDSWVRERSGPSLLSTPSPSLQASQKQVLEKERGGGKWEPSTLQPRSRDFKEKHHQFDVCVHRTDCTMGLALLLTGQNRVLRFLRIIIP